MTYKVTATIKIEHDTAMTERLHVNTTVYDCDDIKHAFSKSFDKFTAMTISLPIFLTSLKGKGSTTLPST